MEIFATYTKLTPGKTEVIINIDKVTLLDSLDKRYNIRSLHDLRERLENTLKGHLWSKINKDLEDSKEYLELGSINIINLKQILVNCSEFINVPRNSCCEEYSSIIEFEYCPKCGKLL